MAWSAEAVRPSRVGKRRPWSRTSDRTSTALWQPKIKHKIKPKEDKQDGLHLACPYTKCDDATQEQLFRCRAKAFPDTHRLNICIAFIAKNHTAHAAAKSLPQRSAWKPTLA
ncbi:hypothetical protein CGCVW01_v002135 [Colletotrichum viniferum]|nr:hypothetical protein CGCVW01_v002135 [Colletotrichum viniferum]